jgi:hypothetical protein
MITAIIDCDPMIYAAGFVTEHAFYDVYTLGGKHIKTFEGKSRLNEWLKENDKTEKDFRIDKRVETEPVQNAFRILSGQLHDIRKRFQAEQMLLFLTDDRKGYNFRDYVAMQQKYKDRPNNKRPIYYDQMRQYLVEQHGAVVVTGFEADDAVAMQTWASICYEDQETVLVSIDKDLNMVPGRHYNPDKKYLYTVPTEEAMRNFYTQLLTGDTTDSIPGMPGIGPKKAETILKDCDDEDDLFRETYAVYKKKYKDAGLYVMTEQARLLWMLRWAGDVWLPNDSYFKEASK